MPHYVTFQSDMDRLRSTQAQATVKASAAREGQS
jgi:alpha-D-ribose 1-methylphosphonate 5-triphosphate synthase subunit PhnI